MVIMLLCKGNPEIASDRFHIHAVVDEVQILVFLLDIVKIFVIVNIVGVKIELISGLFLLLTLIFISRKPPPPSKTSARTPTRGSISFSSFSTG